MYPHERDAFQPYPDEINCLAEAAEFLGLQALSDLCSSKVSSFDTRVRKDRYIRFSEIKKRNNEQNELLIILDGMVLDITRWLEQHPGGPSIIPTQALNIECSVFFEMYHVSRQSFLYLKSFYIGELDPDDVKTLRSSGEGVSASPAFLKSLRSFTEWRVKVNNSAAMEVHKSF
uniref:Cytochrome b5 heme-binding domain-containing protein n=1 Tax=Leptocylindrus danicus TaxID=163516 RepID=A0A7S2KMS2_9STRA